MKSHLGIAVLATFLLVPAVPASAINIYSGDIVDGEVKTADLDSNAVTSAKILNGEVKTADLGADAVTTNKILNGTIVTDDLANGAVTDAKISGQISSSKINSTGLNADTLDGIDSTGFAPASHAHAQSDVTGLATALAGKADASHNHDAVYQRKYGNVVVVAKTGGDFPDPISAMNLITNATAENPMLLKIMPGIYDLGAQSLDMKEYVDIEGSGENVTVIRSTSYGYGVTTVNGARNAEIRFLTAIALGVDGNTNDMAVGITNANMSHVTVSASAMGCAYSYGVNNSGNFAQRMRDVKVYASGANFNWGVYNNGSNPLMSNMTVTASGGNYSYGVSNFDSSLTMNDVAVYTNGAAVQSIGLYTTSGTTFIDRSTFDGTYYSVYSEGSSSVKIGGSKIGGNVVGNAPSTCVASYNGNYAPLDASCH